MKKFALTVILLAIFCLAFDQKNVHAIRKLNENLQFDQLADNWYQSQNVDVQPEHLDQGNAAYLRDFNEKFEDDNLDEIKAIQGHMKYQDGVRDTLLKFSSDLRKSKNITTAVANTFFKVIDGLEKEIAEFHAALRSRRVTNATLRNIENFIKEAAKNKNNTKILRALTSQGLFLAERVAEDSARKRSLDGTSLGARVFLEKIKSDIGTKNFEDFLSINGQVTLIFAIDDTGSMYDDIVAVQHICEHIIKARSRKGDGIDVDFILSPFNDPDTGPLTRKEVGESAEFLEAIKSLSASGGGDCKELGFTGMINAFDGGPRIASSMYVFSDAPPKDATDSNKKILRDVANDFETKINFFLRKSCDNEAEYEPYDEVAKQTGGYSFNLKNEVELGKLGADIIDNTLEGTAPISSVDWGWATWRRRRASDQTYLIPVDDSIEKLSIIVTAENTTGIQLINPIGDVVVNGSVPLSDGLVYNLDSLIPGTYKLIIPIGIEHKYRANGVSKINIDFGHQYVTIPKRGTRIPVPLEQPLQGFPVKAFITIAGAEFVKPDSLTIKVVDINGTVHADKPLTAVGTSGMRYFLRFDPPSGPFKLQLYGQTRKGNSFVRQSSKYDQTVPVLLKLSYRENSNILQRGKTTKITVRILRGDIGPKTQNYILSLKDERGYGSVYRPPRPVYRGRPGFAGIQFNVTSDVSHVTAGETETVKLSLMKDGKTSPVASLTFSFLFV